MIPKTPVLYDGDMGGDDLWAIAILLAHLDRFDIRGIASVFGNVRVEQATKNALNLLHWLKFATIPVVQGAAKPYDGVQLTGDDAYGTDGVGGVILPESPQKAEHVDIADWYNMQVDASPAPITVVATGPATNLALFAQIHPDNARKLEQIIFMGGAIAPPGKDGVPFVMKNGENRVGNITPYSEFNAYCDPHALNILLNNGVKLIFMAADATQFMVLTPDRQERIKALHETYGTAFHSMLMASEHLDRGKFGVDGPFIHDPNVATYLIQQNLYEGISLPKLHFMEEDANGPQGQFRGMAQSNPLELGKLRDESHHVAWLNKIINPDHVFDLIESSLRTIIENAVKVSAS